MRASMGNFLSLKVMLDKMKGGDGAKVGDMIEGLKMVYCPEANLDESPDDVTKMFLQYVGDWFFMGCRDRNIGSIIRA